MSLCKIALVLTVCVCAFSGFAGTVRFRSGKLLAAELTTRSVAVRNANADAFPALPANPIYAVVSLKLDPMRSISVFDYSLEAFGRIFPCIAISRDGNFEYYDGNVSGPDTQQLLFVLDARQVGLQKTETIRLKCNIKPADGTYDREIEFKTIGNRMYTPARNIPAAGLMTGAGK